MGIQSKSNPSKHRRWEENYGWVNLPWSTCASFLVHQWSLWQEPKGHSLLWVLCFFHHWVWGILSATVLFLAHMHSHQFHFGHKQLRFPYLPLFLSSFPPSLPPSSLSLSLSISLVIFPPPSFSASLSPNKRILNGSPGVNLQSWAVVEVVEQFKKFTLVDPAGACPPWLMPYRSRRSGGN